MRSSLAAPCRIEEAEWRDALVTVESGELELVMACGRSCFFQSGDLLWLQGLPLASLRNRGDEPTVLVGRFTKPGATMIEAMAVREAPQAQALEEYRTELTGYCYRMLGSAFEAEDAVQETMLRAWRALDKFEGRSQLRSWLYSIATNVCLDVLGGKERKVRPIQLGEPGAPVIESLAATRPQGEWVLPMPDGRVVDDGGDPAEVAAAKETLKLAFIAALQFLPPKQRAVLILRDVLRWKASEVAELLDTSEASVNSALQRARATLEERDDHDRRARPTRWTTSTRTCSSATWTRSSATTWTRSPRCSTRTRRCRCRRTSYGSPVTTTSSAG